MARYPTATLCLLALLAATTGCGRDPRRAPETAGGDRPIVNTVQHGEVRASVTVHPPVVRLEHDLLLTITLDAPARLDISLPAITDRLAGFTVSGLFDETDTPGEGRVTQSRHVKLTPVVAEEYRIAPLVVEYSDPGEAGTGRQWFTTPPVLLPAQPIVDGTIPDDISADIQPLWIAPTPFSIIAAISGLLLLVLMALVLVTLSRRVRQTIRTARLSPRERALCELDSLLKQGLIEARRIKDFYVELTMIVRRYIERQHRIRAPEQTTDEFLAAVTEHERFRPETVRLLQAFLESADLVKFAGRDATREETSSALATARRYIETDAPEA